MFLVVVALLIIPTVLFALVSYKADHCKVFALGRRGKADPGTVRMLRRSQVVLAVYCGAAWLVTIVGGMYLLRADEPYEGEPIYSPGTLMTYSQYNACLAKYPTLADAEAALARGETTC